MFYQGKGRHFDVLLINCFGENIKCIVFLKDISEENKTEKSRLGFERDSPIQFPTTILVSLCAPQIEFYMRIWT